MALPFPFFTCSSSFPSSSSSSCSCSFSFCAAAASVSSTARVPLYFTNSKIVRPFETSSAQLPVLFSRFQTRISAAEVPDYLPATWVISWENKPIGPRLNLTAEEAVHCQLEALKYNNEPHVDHGVEVMYKFASFDPFQRSKYFGPVLDIGQFERFRRIFHHSAYRALLSHKQRKILSSLDVEETRFKQRIWAMGSRPDEEEVFEFTMVQKVGGFWDGYWVTESLLHDGEGLSKGIAY